MRRTKATTGTNVLSTLTKIYEEAGRVEKEFTGLLASAKNLTALQEKVQAVMDSRANSIAALLTKSVSATDLAKLPAKIGVIEKSSNSTLLKLQMNMQRENQIFTSISNVLKTRHDTVKNSIGNIR